MYCNGSGDVLWQAVAPAWQAGLGLAGKAAGLVPSWSALAAALVGTLAVAMAIRLMDDTLDASMDASQGLVTYAQLLSEAVLPYALAAFAVGALIIPTLAVALFAAAYIVGMASDYTRSLLFGLKGWQEGVIALVLGLLGTGIVCMAWSLAFMLFTQSLDDVFDYRYDTQAGRRNLCHRYGIGETMLLMLSVFIISIMLSPLLTLIGIVALVCTMYITPRVSVLGE